MYVANARLAGRCNDAVEHARKATLPESGEEPTPNGGKICIDCAGPGSPEVVLTLVRFGKWQDVLKESLPESWGGADFQGYNKAAWHYSRAVAYWASSKQVANKTHYVELGDAEAKLCLAAAPQSASPAQAFNYTVIIPEQLRAARAMHIDEDYATAIEHLRNVRDADDANMYLEPPRVWYPPRECLGALLVSAPKGKGLDAKDALKTFQDDLTAFVESPWSLFGASQAAQALGMSSLAKNYSTRAKKAWSQADAPFSTPCPEMLA